jgi:dihydroxy-acid dehydratase
MKDIDRLSRRVPQLCKVAPSTPKYHMEDVHRAGGIMAILGELDRAGCCTPTCRPCTARRWRRRSRSGTWCARSDAAVHGFFRAGPGGVPTQTAFSQSTRWPSLDLDRAERLHPRRRARLLAGRRARRALRQHRADGCVVKTAGVDESI